MSAETRTEATTRSPLGIPIFRAIWCANLVSNFGSMIQGVGASWMMTALSGSAIHVALVQSSTTLPIMLFALVAGALADSVDRRSVMLASQVAMLVLSTALALFTLLGLMTPWMLLAFTFTIGCGQAFNGPAWQASVGEMVPRPLLPNAIALNSVGFNIARSTGPALGGTLVAVLGAGAAFLLNALSYIGVIGVLLSWKPPQPDRHLPRERLGTAIVAGLRYVSLSPDLKRVMLRATLFGLAASATSALMPLVARDLVGGGAMTFGLLLGAFGLGSISSALLLSRLRHRLTTEWIVRLAMLALIVGSVVTAESRLLPLTLVGLYLGGGGWMASLSSFNASTQLGSPRWVVARTVSMYQMTAFGGMAVGSWVVGMLAERYGVSDALLAAAAFQTLGLLLGLVMPMPQLADRNLDPLGRFSEPQTAVPVEGQSGKILIALHYRIAPEQVAPFLEAMEQRRRIRRRDGARRWRLLRDLADEWHWVEHYEVRSWNDYVRHNERRTQADISVSDTLRGLHQGEWPPMVYRMMEQRTIASTQGGQDRTADSLDGGLTDMSTLPQGT